MDRVKKTSGERLYKAFVYLVLGLLAISIIVPVAWVFLASIKQNSEFSMATPGRCPPAFTGRTLWMPGTRPAWAAICSIPSL